MKKIFIITLFLSFFISNIAFAEYRLFETNDEAYDRQSRKNYEVYQRNSYNPPLGVIIIH